MWLPWTVVLLADLLPVDCSRPPEGGPRPPADGRSVSSHPPEGGGETLASQQYERISTWIAEEMDRITAPLDRGNHRFLLHENFGLSYHGRSVGKGLTALRSFRRGELAGFIPITRIISDLNVKQHIHDGLLPPRLLEDSAFDRLIVFLALHRKLETSPLEPYLALLPKDFQHLPRNWNWEASWDEAYEETRPRSWAGFREFVNTKTAAREERLEKLLDMTNSWIVPPPTEDSMMESTVQKFFWEKREKNPLSNSDFGFWSDPARHALTQRALKSLTVADLSYAWDVVAML